MRSGQIRRVWRHVLILLVAAAVGLVSSAQAQVPSCDRNCLTGLVERYLEGVLDFDQMAIPARLPELPWSERVRFTENDVGLMLGDGHWGTATAFGVGQVFADPMTGNVLWYGIVEEHGQPAYFALRLAVEGMRIVEIEAVVGREGAPAPFAPTDAYGLDASYSRSLPAAQRLPRARLEALVDGYYNSMQLNDGTVQTAIADDCVRITNGRVTTVAEGIAGCRQQLELGFYRYVDRVRARRYPIIDEVRGVVVALSLLDHAARYVDYQTLDGLARKIPVEYPHSHGVLELFKVEDGAIKRIEGVTAFQPYLMPTQWVP